MGESGLDLDQTYIIQNMLSFKDIVPLMFLIQHRVGDSNPQILPSLAVPVVHHHAHVLQPTCTQTFEDVCVTVNEKQCSQNQVANCITTNETRCANQIGQECISVQETICKNVPQEICVEVNETDCETSEGQKCNEIIETDCETTISGSCIDTETQECQNEFDTVQDMSCNREQNLPCEEITKPVCTSEEEQLCADVKRWNVRMLKKKVANKKLLWVKEVNALQSMRHFVKLLSGMIVRNFISKNATKKSRSAHQFLSRTVNLFQSRNVFRSPSKNA